jgi:hypothetical protein
MVRFGSFVYMLAKDNVSGLCGVYRAAPAAGNNAFSWSSQLVTFAALADVYPAGLAADANYIYAAEYGNVAAGPSLYRSSDGVAWSTVFGPQASWRHIHCVAPDPFNAGNVWLSGGDGVGSPIQVSRDSGGSWTAVPIMSGRSKVPQCVQVSFSADYVFGAGDDGVLDPTATVFDRRSLRYWDAGSNRHTECPLPSGVASWDPQALFGFVDPSTGVYYCATLTSGPYPTPGLWYLPRVGMDYRLLSWGEQGGLLRKASSLMWFGQYRRAVLSCDWPYWNG